METTDIKRTYHYHIEDALKLQQGDAVMMYFRTNADKVRKRFYQNKPLLAAEIQVKKIPSQQDSELLDKEICQTNL